MLTAPISSDSSPAMAKKDLLITCDSSPFKAINACVLKHGFPCFTPPVGARSWPLGGVSRLKMSCLHHNGLAVDRSRMKHLALKSLEGSRKGMKGTCLVVPWSNLSQSFNGLASC